MRGDAPDREVFDALVEGGNLEIDESRLASCLAAGRAAVGQATTIEAAYAVYLGFTPEEGTTIDYSQAPACEGVFTPRGASGDDCVASVECIAPLQCVLDLTSHTAKCLPLAEEGDPCFDGSDNLLRLPCAEGLACVNEVCEPLAGPGESCAVVECQDDLYCSDAEGTTCQVRAAEGDDCSGDVQCEDGTFCSDATTCVSDTPVAMGQPCYDGRRPCEDFCLTCRPLNVGEVSVCALRAAVGEPCLDDFNCQAGLHCPDETVCAPLGGINDACMFEGDCEGDLVCEGGVCATPAGEGDSCAAVECIEGLFCVNTLCVPDSLGARCSYDGDCLDEQVCRSAEPPAERVCGLPLGVGADCLASGDCADGLYCSEGTCAAQGGANALCSLDEECAGEQCRDGRCVGHAPTPTASCLANSPDTMSIFVFFGCVLAFRLRLRRPVIDRDRYSPSRRGAWSSRRRGSRPPRRGG